MLVTVPSVDCCLPTGADLLAVNIYIYIILQGIHERLCVCVCMIVCVCVIACVCVRTNTQAQRIREREFVEKKKKSKQVIVEVGKTLKQLSEQ